MDFLGGLGNVDVDTIFKKGCTGMVAGGATGFIVGSIASVINEFRKASIDDPPEWAYINGNVTLNWRKMVDTFEIGEDIMLLYMLRSVNPEAFHKGIRYMSIFCKATEEEDTFMKLSLLVESAKQMDLCFRILLFDIKNVGGVLDTNVDEVESMIMSFHFTAEVLVDDCRNNASNNTGK